MTLYIFFTNNGRNIRVWTTDKKVADGYAKQLGVKPTVFVESAAEKEQQK